MDWSTADGQLTGLTLICVVLATICLVASIVALHVERKTDREWADYMDTYAPGWSAEDE
jgi:uncharacterized membrane protein